MSTVKESYREEKRQRKKKDDQISNSDSGDDELQRFRFQMNQQKNTKNTTRSIDQLKQVKFKSKSNQVDQTQKSQAQQQNVKSQQREDEEESEQLLQSPSEQQTKSNKNKGFNYQLNKMKFMNDVIEKFDKCNIAYPDNLLDKSDFADRFVDLLSSYNIEIPDEKSDSQRKSQSKSKQKGKGKSATYPNGQQYPPQCAPYPHPQQNMQPSPYSYGQPPQFNLQPPINPSSQQLPVKQQASINATTKKEESKGKKQDKAELTSNSSNNNQNNFKSHPFGDLPRNNGHDYHNNNNNNKSNNNNNNEGTNNSSNMFNTSQNNNSSNKFQITNSIFNNNFMMKGNNNNNNNNSSSGNIFGNNSSGTSTNNMNTNIGNPSFQEQIKIKLGSAQKSEGEQNQFNLAYADKFISSFKEYQGAPATTKPYGTFSHSWQQSSLSKKDNMSVQCIVGDSRYRNEAQTLLELRIEDYNAARAGNVPQQDFLRLQEKWIRNAPHLVVKQQAKQTQFQKSNDLPFTRNYDDGNKNENPSFQNTEAQDQNKPVKPTQVESSDQDDDDD